MGIRIITNPESWSTQRIMYIGINSLYLKFITFYSKDLHSPQTCNFSQHASNISWVSLLYTPNFIHLSLNLYRLFLSNRKLATRILACIKFNVSQRSIQSRVKVVYVVSLTSLSDHKFEKTAALVTLNAESYKLKVKG